MKRGAVCLLTGLALFLILLELGSIYLLYKHGLWVRFVKIESWQSVGFSSTKTPGDYQTKTAKEPWLLLSDPKEQYIGALRWTMNRCRKIGFNQNSGKPAALLKSVESGAGALCGDMVTIFQNVLAANQLPCRRVQLYRNFFDIYDSHETMEVFIDRRWVVLDPTFGVSYQNSKGEMLSAHDIKKNMLLGRFQDVKPVFYGEVRYPARLEKYYINYLVLYNNVFIEDRTSNLFLKIPPFCYIGGSKLYYQKLDFESDFHFRLIQSLYFFFSVIVPFMILTIIGFILATIFIRRGRNVNHGCKTRL